MPGMVYKWRDGTRLKIDAQRAGEEVEHLRNQANGQLTPAQLVDAARSQKSILHEAFEWEDSVAAERYREDQARYLIGCLVVTIKPKGVNRDMRAFVNVTKDDNQGYTALHTAMSDADLRAQVLVRAWEELEAWRNRYAGYLELAQVFEAIDAEASKKLRKSG